MSSDAPGLPRSIGRFLVDWRTWAMYGLIFGFLFGGLVAVEWAGMPGYIGGVLVGYGLAVATQSLIDRYGRPGGPHPHAGGGQA